MTQSSNLIDLRLRYQRVHTECLLAKVSAAAKQAEADAAKVALDEGEKHFAAKKIQAMVRGKLVRNKIGITEIELMKTNNMEQKSANFHCEKCKYSCARKDSFDRHKKSAKHLAIDDAKHKCSKTQRC